MEHIFIDDNINIDNKKYKLRAYIEEENIVFNLEFLPNKAKKIIQKEYIEKFNKYFLENIDPTYKLIDLEDIFEEIYEKLEGKKYKIKIKGNLVELIIKKNRKKSIMFLLNEKKNEIDINYEVLSDEMKNIIDKNELIIGIDLGTTYSCASVFIDNNFIIIPNSLGARITSSYVSFLSENKIYVGDLAKFFPSKENNIIYNIKRLIGRSYNDKEIKNILRKKLLPFEIIEDKEFDTLKIKVKFKKEKEYIEYYYYPEQISAFILKQIIKDSEYYLSKKIGKEIQIKNVVLTIPAYFNQKQRKATKIAAQIAGLNVKGMINEPTAACLAYSLKSFENRNNYYIIVIDFGGGTLDITLIKLERNENGTYCVVKFTFGDSNFGGDDFDMILMEKYIGQKKEYFNKNLPINKRLKEVCEKAKIKLTKKKSFHTIIKEYQPNMNLEIDIEQEKFDIYCKELFDKFDGILKKFKNDCGIKMEEIKEVILIGGATILPKIEKIVGENFGEDKIKKNLERKEAVSIGASIQGARISNLPFVNHIKLLDVTNLSLGVNTKGNKMIKIIARSSPFPIPGKNIFKTVHDNQTEARIKVYEGENESNSENLFLGEFKINLPKRKAGEARIEIILDIDEYSLLNVTATEVENKDNSIKKIYEYDTNYKGIDKIDRLQIIEPKNIGQIIENLHSTLDKTQFIEFEEIKESIIENEEKIFEFSKLGEAFEENIRNLKLKLIEIMANFGETLLQNMYNMDKPEKSKEEKNIMEKIFFSFVKLFTLRVNEYFFEYSNEKNENIHVNKDINKNDNIINSNEDNENCNKAKCLNNIRNYLCKFLKQIQFDNVNILYEIFDDCEINSEIYEFYISFLIINYDERLNEQFYSNNLNLEELNDLELIIDRCLILLNKIKDLSYNLAKKKDYFEDYKNKIKGKRIILRQKWDKEIDNILKKYENSIYLQTKDYRDIDCLKKLREGKNMNIPDKIIFSERKERIFQNKLRSFYENGRWKEMNNFVYILQAYPPKERYLPDEYKKKELSYVVKENYYKSGNAFEKFLEVISEVYKDMIRKDNLSNDEAKIYEMIIKFFNFSRNQLFGHH